MARTSEVTVQNRLPLPTIATLSENYFAPRLELLFLTPVADRKFGVRMGAWQSCSALCGGGTQARDVYCANVDSGQERYRTFCGIPDDEFLDRQKSRACNPLPCECLGLCLDEGICRESSAQVARLGCRMVADKSPKTGWLGAIHKAPPALDWSRLGSLAREGSPGSSSGSENVAALQPFPGVLESISFRLVKPQPLASSYLFMAKQRDQAMRATPIV